MKISPNTSIMLGMGSGQELQAGVVFFKEMIVAKQTLLVFPAHPKHNGSIWSSRTNRRNKCKQEKKKNRKEMKRE